MRALRLDYYEDRRVQNFLGFVLLALALALAAAVLWYYNGLSAEHKRLDAVVKGVESKLQQGRQPVANNLNDVTKDVINYDNHVIQKLGLPWDNLFVVMEKAMGENIALLGVEPNAKDAKVKLTGEAKDFKSMFEYVRALREQPALKSVYLLDHKIDDQNPDKPIHFSLEAAWVEKT